MDFVLAKALKDAGFYQGGKGTRVAPPAKLIVRRDDFAYVPTLEELIEACPKRIVNHEFALRHYGASRWIAGYTLYEDWTPAQGIGKSPTEAVARLWLALHEKEAANDRHLR